MLNKTHTFLNKCFNIVLAYIYLSIAAHAKKKLDYIKNKLLV